MAGARKRTDIMFIVRARMSRRYDSKGFKIRTLHER